MDGLIGDETSTTSFHINQDLNPSLPANPTGGATMFDASQYAFFGNDVVEEVELGGLEDEESDLGQGGIGDEGFQFEREEGDTFASLSEVDDLSRTFSELNKGVTGPTSGVINGDWGSREGSSTAEWAREEDFTNLFERRGFDAGIMQENKQWSSQPYTSPHIADPNSLHRTSSYPEQQQQQQHPHQQQSLHHHYSTDPILIPISKSPFTSFPPNVGRSPQASPNGQFIHPNMSHQPGPNQMPISSPNLSPFRNSQLQLGGNLPQLPHGLPPNSRMQNQWANRYPIDRVGPPNNIQPQQFPNQNGLMPIQNRMQHPFQPSFGGSQPPNFNPHFSQSPPMMNNLDMIGSPDLRDQRAMTMLGNRQGMRYHPHQGGGGGWPRWRSKFMTSDELENILRMQLAATHSNDPYVDDYYHQACLARKSAGAKLRHHFCPVNLGDGSTRPNASNEPHPFLKVDALGRVSFSSIRRPRPLLEVDAPSSSSSGGPESKLVEKPLEQEPLLAARVTIEDGLSLLLDVDDIDRFLQFNQLQDGGSELRQRRHVLLEGLATSLHLVDPLGKHGHTVELAPRDDFLFLRLLSLPKGRKLLVRYLELLPPGELARVVCMAIFRHLRFLFGNIPSDTDVSKATTNLAMAVSSCARNMELKSIAACLASVVCSAEHPPLRPVGSPAGDGASLILQSVLERATELLTDPNLNENCSASSRAFWQASFDAFFGLLTKYCFSKYDSVVQSFLAQGPQDLAAIGAELAAAITSEVPVELLRASIPHTNEQQKEVIVEFAQRSMPTSGQSGGSGSS